MPGHAAQAGALDGARGRERGSDRGWHRVRDALASHGDVAIGLALGLAVLAPPSAYILAPQLDVLRVAVAIPAIPAAAALSRSMPRIHRVDLLLVGFLYVALVSWVFGSDAANPQLLVGTLIPFAFYAWGRVLCTRENVLTIAWSLVIIGTLASLTVLLEFAVLREPLSIDLAQYDYGPDPALGLIFRPGGTFGSPGGAALVLSMTALLAGALVTITSHWRRRVALVCLVITVLGMIVTFNRGSYIGLALGALGYLVLTLPRASAWRLARRGAPIAAAVVIAVALVAGSGTFQGGILRPETADYRFSNWSEAADAATGDPVRLLFGEGFNGLLLASPEYGGVPFGAAVPMDSELISDGPHNQYLLTLLELGILGTALLAAWFFFVIWGGVRATRAADRGSRPILAALSMAVLSYAIACLFGDHLRYDVGVAVMGLLAGGLVSLSGGSRSSSS
jgi:O-antigen ligase